MPEVKRPTEHPFTVRFGRIVSEIVTNVGVLRPFLSGESGSEVLPMQDLWDTGATHCCITREAAQRARLPAIGRAMVIGVHSKHECTEYYLDLVLPNQVMVPSVRAIESEGLDENFDVIIGMNVITLGDFAISQPGNETIFTFRIPSVESIDFVEQAEAYNIENLKKSKGSQTK